MKFHLTIKMHILYYDTFNYATFHSANNTNAKVYRNSQPLTGFLANYFASFPPTNISKITCYKLHVCMLNGLDMIAKVWIIIENKFRTPISIQAMFRRYKPSRLIDMAPY